MSSIALHRRSTKIALPSAADPATLHELETHEIADVVRVYVARLVDLEGDKRMRYVLIFKNQGE